MTNAMRATLLVAIVVVATDASAHVPPQCEPNLEATETALNAASDKMRAVNDSAMQGQDIVLRGEAMPPLTYAVHLQALGEFFIALGDLPTYTS